MTGWILVTAAAAVLHLSYDQWLAGVNHRYIHRYIVEDTSIGYIVLSHASGMADCSYILKDLHEVQLINQSISWFYTIGIIYNVCWLLLHTVITDGVISTSNQVISFVQSIWVSHLNCSVSLSCSSVHMIWYMCQMKWSVFNFFCLVWFGWYHHWLLVWLVYSLVVGSLRSLHIGQVRLPSPHYWIIPLTDLC